MLHHHASSLPPLGRHYGCKDVCIPTAADASVDLGGLRNLVDIIDALIGLAATWICHVLRWRYEWIHVSFGPTTSRWSFTHWYRGAEALFAWDSHCTVRQGGKVQQPRAGGTNSDLGSHGLANLAEPTEPQFTGYDT